MSDVADPHLAAEVLAAYIDDTLSSAERADAETHLATCSACRRELADSSRLVLSAPAAAPARRRVSRLAVGAAAAALIAVVLTRAAQTWRPDDIRTERRTAAGERSVVRTLSPSPERPVDPKDLTFVWHRDDSATYRVTVTDSAGGLLWAGTTQDTIVRLPADIRLAPGARHYWNVDALRTDGFSISSGHREFRTVR